MNYRNILLRGTTILKKNNLANADIDAECLLSYSLNKSRENILLNLDEKINLNKFKNYISLIYRRRNKEPISHITKKRFFWKSDFFINNKVLTPRFETELLVEHILKIFRFSNRLNMIDLGLGSGCILISILKEKKHWVGTGVDLSKLAIKIAKTNAKIQQVYNRIRFINSDVDKYIDGKYDLVVSNPPYINKVGYNNLDVSVKDYEPKLALYGGIDGYKIIEKVIKKSKCILKTKGILAMEIGIDQKYKSIKFLENNGFYVQKIIKDYQNIDRHIFAIKL